MPARRSWASAPRAATTDRSRPPRWPSPAAARGIHRRRPRRAAVDLRWFDLGLFEINEAAQLVAQAAHPDANIIFGAVIDDALGDEVRVTVIAAGFDGGAPGDGRRRPASAAPRPTRRRSRLQPRRCSPLCGAGSAGVTYDATPAGNGHQSGNGHGNGAPVPASQSARDAPLCSRTTSWTCPTSSSSRLQRAGRQLRLGFCPLRFHRPDRRRQCCPVRLPEPRRRCRRHPRCRRREPTPAGLGDRATRLPARLPRQVHGVDVAVVDGPWPAGALPPQVDAIVTTSAELGLVVVVADCFPVLLADDDSGMVRCARGEAWLGGWTGPTRRVRHGGTCGSPERIDAVVGPGICGACYEVPPDLHAEVSAIVPEASSRTRVDTSALDIRAGIHAQLRRAGVHRPTRNAERCTFEDAALFSHRRHRPTGRLAGVAWRPG